MFYEVWLFLALGDRVLSVANYIVDMTIGIVLGMVASPVMMKLIRVIKQRRKISRLLREISRITEIRTTSTALIVFSNNGTEYKNKKWDIIYH